MDANVANMVRGVAQKNVLRQAGVPAFKTFAEVQEWVDQNGGGPAGELALRNALAQSTGAPLPVIVLMESWIARLEQERAGAHESAMLEVNTRSALAAEKSASSSERAARYAMWSAAISAAVGIISAATYWLTRVPG